MRIEVAHLLIAAARDMKIAPGAEIVELLPGYVASGRGATPTTGVVFSRLAVFAATSAFAAAKIARDGDLNLTGVLIGEIGSASWDRLGTEFVVY